MQFNKVFEDWLSTNKITDGIQQEFSLSFNDNIVIPVHDADGTFVFNKYRRSPLSDVGPKYTYDKGGKVTLYGWWKAKTHNTILITEGEKDALVAWSHNIPAVTSTGGAMSFQEEWADLLKDKEVIICFDNDEAGANGIVKALQYLPNAKVLLLPEKANMKDISDYVVSGGDLHELIKTARSYTGISDVSDDRGSRIALFKSIFFHEAYIKAHTKIAPKNAPFKSFASDDVTRAKEYPMTNLLAFNRNKIICPFHAGGKEKTPSFNYYPETNTAYCFGMCGKVFDSIEVYKSMHSCSFKKAVEELNDLQI